MSKNHPLVQVVSGDEAVRVLTATLTGFDVGHLALYDGTCPYVVPVNHTALYLKADDWQVSAQIAY